jgi:osmoprotectant transport system substrate-binding protein
VGAPDRPDRDYGALATPRREEGAVRRPRAWTAAALLLLALLPACGGDPAAEPLPGTPGPGAALRLVSYDFRENQILVEVYAVAARRAGVPVEVTHGVGTREVVAPALAQGVVDAVVDYTGTALAFARPDAAPARRTPEELHAVLERTLGGRGVTALRAAEAEDQNGFVVTTAFAGERGVTTLSDLAPLAAGLRFGGPPECPERPFCLPGLQQVYGLEFAEVRAVPSRAATAEALIAGQIDVGMLETTDARLSDSSLVLLEDDRGLQPHEEVVPLVRTAALERWGAPLRAAFDDVSARLTTADLVRLNRAVEVRGLTPAEAAERWWEQQ